MPEPTTTAVVASSLGTSLFEWVRSGVIFTLLVGLYLLIFGQNKSIGSVEEKVRRNEDQDAKRKDAAVVAARAEAVDVVQASVAPVTTALIQMVRRVDRLDRAVENHGARIASVEERLPSFVLDQTCAARHQEASPRPHPRRQRDPEVAEMPADAGEDTEEVR